MAREYSSIIDGKLVSLPALIRLIKRRVSLGERVVDALEQIEAEAACWMVEIDEGVRSPEQRRDLDEWLNRSAEHRRALAEQMAAWQAAEWPSTPHVVLIIGGVR